MNLGFNWNAVPQWIWWLMIGTLGALIMLAIDIVVLGRWRRAQASKKLAEDRVPDHHIRQRKNQSERRAEPVSDRGQTAPRSGRGARQRKCGPQGPDRESPRGT